MRRLHWIVGVAGLVRPLSRYANLLAFAGISAQALIFWRSRQTASQSALHVPPA
jgi:hypothetical protein